jgi:hypothetical protein
MNRKFGVSILILCFASSNIHLAWATEMIEVAPVIVQPEMQELNEQMINRDRQNRDEEIAIKQLIEDNDQLTQTTLAHQQNEGLAKINQTMLSYRDALLSRDRARIVANGERGWTSRYGDLIALTEDADAMTVPLEKKNDLLAEKYQMLTQLKDEMTALNEKLSSKSQDIYKQKETTIDGFKKIAQEQEDKIQMLTQRLGEMDQRISKYDAIIAEKDHQIALLKDEAAAKDEVIKNQKDQIDILQGQLKEGSVPVPSAHHMTLPPIVVNASSNQQPQPAPALPVFNTAALAAKDVIIKQQQGQLDLLKSELEDRIAQGNKPDQKDEMIKQQEKQITILKQQAEELSSKQDLIKSQADQMARASEQFKDNSALYASVQAQVVNLRNTIHAQDLDLKAKNDSIRWLHQVLAVAKNKAQYYQLTSQVNQIPMKQLQEEVQRIKSDFAQRLKDYDQFENAVASLKDQVSQLSLQLAKKQAQVNLLKTELENKITEAKNKGQQDAQAQQDLKAQLQDKEDQIVKMKTDVLTILQAQANKEIYRRNAAAQVDDRVKLAQQLIDLQAQETALLEEKNNLAVAQNAIFDQHALDLESKIKDLLAQHQIQTVDLQSHMQELKNELAQKEEQVNSYKAELGNKIAEEKSQSVLEAQIQDLKSQLQDNEAKIATMNAQLEAGQKTQEEADSLKQQLAAEQDKADQLKQQLDSKTSQSDQMTMMMGDYQKKLESRDNAYNKQLKQILSADSYKMQMEKQIADLNAQLQEREAEVVKIKKDMYDSEELANAKDKDIQTKDLSMSMVQQKMLDDKINEYQGKINGLQATNVNQVQEVINLKTELALARQQLEGMPSSDEIAFLRTGLQKATLQLKQKDAALLQIKANAAEYAKEFKEQTQEFQSLKDQLLDAQAAIAHKDEDLKYKDMALTRLKVISRGLTQRIDAAEKNLMSKTHGYKVEDLQMQLKRDNARIKDLQAQLNQLRAPSKDNTNNTMEEKLQQALNKINEQGRLINALAQKLQGAGQSVDLSKI